MGTDNRHIDDHPGASGHGPDRHGHGHAEHGHEGHAQQGHGGHARPRHDHEGDGHAGPAGDGHGHLIRGPRRYELTAMLGFFGRRRRVYDGLVALSGAGPGERVLDIGCGTGYFTRRIAPAVAPGGRAVGIDPSASLLGYAAHRSPANCTFETAIAQALPFADGSFDAAVSSLAMHHVPEQDRAAAVREAYRVLRPGGRLLIVELNRHPRHLRLARPFGGTPQHAMGHLSGGDLATLLREAGFEVTGAGERRPSLHYVAARRPGQP